MAFPLILGLAGAGALKGMMDSKENRRMQRQMDDSRKATIMYSPWTGMSDPGYTNVGNTSALGGILGGGLQGASIGMMANGLMGAGGGTPSAGAQGTQNVLGGQDMSAQLGEMGGGAEKAVMQATGNMPQQMDPNMIASTDEFQQPAFGMWSSMQPRYGVNR
jgi:hypothetical protein